MSNSKKWPFGFYVCSLTFTFERLAYYAGKWGIGVFPVIAAAEGGLGLSTAEGAVLSSYFVAFTYITPIIGGFIADRWVAPRLLVPLGEILMGLAYLVAWKATGKGMLIACIVLLAVGTGFFKGNVSGINGRQFEDADESVLNQIFSVQYSFVNIGSFCGTTFLSLLATQYSFRVMFFACAVFMFIDCAWWFFGMRYLGDAGKKPFLHSNKEESKEEEAADNAPLTHKEKQRVAAIVIVTIFSGIFWLVWYMAYLPVYYKFGPVDQGGLAWANWNIGSFTMPTAWFDSANGLFCIILCPVFAVIWKKMAERPQGDWGMFTKTALGLLFLGVCVAVMVLGAIMSGEGSKDPVGIWVVLLVAVFMTVGEVIFSPLGNAFISKYAPKKLLGTLLGVWPFIIFFSGLAYGPLYNWLDQFSFVKAYGAVGIIIAVCGILMLVFTKKFDAMVADEEK